MKQNIYFDYLGLSKRNHMAKSALRKIEREVRKEFPSDIMMYELHMLRAVNANSGRSK